MILRPVCLGLAVGALLSGPVVAQTAAQPAPAAAPATSPSAASPATDAHVGPIPPPPPGKGQVVFFRPSSFRGGMIWFNVRENGVALGKLTSGVYFVKVTDPGAHTYTAATENHNVLHLEVDDGETYYIKGSITMGLLIGEANMSPSDEATFAKSYPKMKVAAEPEAEPAKPGT